MKKIIVQCTSCNTIERDHIFIVNNKELCTNCYYKLIRIENKTIYIGKDIGTL